MEGLTFRRAAPADTERIATSPTRVAAGRTLFGNADLLPGNEPHRWWGTRQVRLMLELLQARGEIAVAG